MSEKYSWSFNTPLGPVVAVGSTKALYSLDFDSTKRLSTDKETDPIRLIQEELLSYFEGKLTEFKTPLFLSGSPFQKRVWEALIKIPYGKTISYLDLAIAVGNPKACRAVAQANGANRFPIIIPCHRVINANGCLGGYSGGIEKKKWLLFHEALKSGRSLPTPMASVAVSKI